MSSGFQRVNGLRLWVHRFRDPAAAPSGLTVVLVHGFMDAGATWDLVAPTLARGGHDVVAPDLRGFGQSDFVGPGGYYHFPDYVADLAELVDALAPRRLALVGHSMGGTIAGLYAGTHPERVERLALLEGMGPMVTDPGTSVDRMHAWLRTLREVSRTPKPLSSLQEAVERLSLHHPRVPREVIEARAKLLTRADESGRLVWAYDPLHRTTAPTPFQVDGFKEFLRRITCPTLVVGGGATGWHPPDEDERIACLANVTRFDLPHAGHMMHWTEPGLLADRLASFLAEGPAVRAGGRRAHASTQERHAGTEMPLPVQSAPGAMPHSAGLPPSGLPAAPVRGPIPPTLVAGTVGPRPSQPFQPGPPAGQAPVGPTQPAAGRTVGGPGQRGGDGRH